MMRWDFWRRKRRETDLDDEIAHDLALDAEERIRSGVTPPRSRTGQPPRFWECGATEGGHSRNVGLDIARTARPGSSIWMAHLAQEPAVRQHGGAVAGAGYRRKRIHLQRDQRYSLPAFTAAWSAPRSWSLSTRTWAVTPSLLSRTRTIAIFATAIPC